MPQVLIKITRNGFGSVQAFFGKQISSAKNLSGPLRQAGEYMMGSVRKNFRAGGRPKWRPLAKSTLKRKLSQGLSPLPLTGRTGRLQSQITYKIFKNKFSIGTSIPYAPYHQFGTRSIPQRKFLIFQDEDLKLIESMILRNILGQEYKGR